MFTTLPDTMSKMEQTKLTLTTLSQPQETMTGFRTLGEKRTQETLKANLVPGLSHNLSRRDSPLSVAILLDVVLALAEGVPELDRPVTGAGDDLPVVSGEADGQYIGGVANEATSGETGVEVPQTESVVPRGRKRELAVRRDDNVRDKVVVAVEDALGVAVGVLITGQLPDNDGFVYTI